MIAIDEDKTTIHLTRGDATQEEFNRIVVHFPIWDDEQEKEVNYEFKLTDKLTFIAFEKKGYTKKEIFKKEYTMAQLGYTEPTETPEIILTTQDTLKFAPSNKKATYWYNVILNDNATIIGSDEDGSKKIIVYPSES